MKHNEQEQTWDIPFDRAHPIPFVKHCRRAFSDITDRNELYALSSELSEVERASEYAKYYHMGPACPTEENIRATEYDNPINPADAFLMEEYAEKMQVKGGYHIKTGYCIMKNGVGFASACTRAEGVSAKRLSHFIERFNPPEDLYYKAWMPGAHVRHYADMAVEDVGFGMVQLRFIEGLTEKTMGMKPLGVGDEHYIGISGANILCQPLHQPEAEPLYTSELCYYRQMPGCYELRVNFWVGMQFENGKSVLHLPNGKPVQEFIPMSLAKHSVWETTTFMRNVLEFTKEIPL